MGLEGYTYTQLAEQHDIRLPSLRTPVDVVDLAKHQYTSTIWTNDTLGRPFGMAIWEMLNGNVSKVVAATDNAKKAALYEHTFDGYNLAGLGGLPVRVEHLSHEQKKAMGAEPAWNNVLYVAANKNMAARRQRPEKNAMIFSTDILTGAVLPTGEWKIFHKLGRIDDLREEVLEERAGEITEIMSRESTWFWLSGTVMQTKDGVMFAGRYYQATFTPVPDKAIEALFVRDFQRGKAQNIPHGVDVLTDLEEFGHHGLGIGVTWQMLQEDRGLSKGVLQEHVARQLMDGQYAAVSIRNLNAMMLGGVPALDGIANVHWERPQSAMYLEKVMQTWLAEEKS